MAALPQEIQVITLQKGYSHYQGKGMQKKEYSRQSSAYRAYQPCPQRRSILGFPNIIKYMSRMNPYYEGERFGKNGEESAKQSAGAKVDWVPHEFSHPE